MHLNCSITRFNWTPSHFGAFSNKCTKSKKSHLKSDTGAYLFGFNGQEKIDEINGAGNDMDFGARIYDARMGRWLSVDPLFKKQPFVSPFKALGNNPIIFIDPDGKIEFETITINDQKTGRSYTMRKIVSQDVMTDGKYQSYYDTEEGKFQPIIKFYDFETITTRTITSDGNIIETKVPNRIMYEHNDKLIEKYENLSDKPNPKERRSTESSLIGKGGTQNGGFFITSNNPLAHSSTTKYFSKSEAMEIKLDDVMLMVKLADLNKMEHIFSQAKAIDGGVDYLNAGIDAAKRVFESLNTADQCESCKYLKYHGSMYAPSDTGGLNIKKIQKVNPSEFH